MDKTLAGLPAVRRTARQRRSRGACRFGCENREPCSFKADFNIHHFSIHFNSIRVIYSENFRFKPAKPAARQLEAGACLFRAENSELVAALVLRVAGVPLHPVDGHLVALQKG